VKKYSDFIAHPVRMKISNKDETLNSQKALWLRPADEIKEEDYTEFYHHLTHDWAKPLKTIHYKAEGTREFTALLFIPKTKPWDYHFRNNSYGLSLYVKRVFIMNNCEDLIPPYLRFMKGLVDSSDLSLNISREMLQKDRQVGQIRKSLTGKILNTLREILENERSTYEEFWMNFGGTVKEGIAFDPALQENNQEKLQNLLLFHSTHSEGWTTLQEYKNRMKPDQKAVYYISGDSLSRIQNSPYLEQLKTKGLEVLLMTDAVDEWVTTHLREYENTPLQSITQDDLKLDGADEKPIQNAKFKSLLEVMRKTLESHVKDVRISTRLTESPVCLVSSAQDPSARMERILKSMGQDMPQNKRILELNADHPLYNKMILLSMTP